MRPMNNLFFDTELEGHHSEYISHVIEYLANNKSIGNYTFIVHPDFSRKFPSIAKKAESVDNISIVGISHLELTKINQGNLIIKSVNTYKLLDKYAKRFSATSVFLLYFNIFQFSLGLFRPDYEIKGILFMQFYRMQKKSLKDKFKYLRKKIQTLFYVRNKQIKRVFVLNDQKTVTYLNNEYNTSIFYLLPDPIPVYIPLPDFNIYNEYSIDKKRKIFLHIGELSERKGTIDILDAFNQLEVKNIGQIALLLIGSANIAIDALIKSKIIILNKKFEHVLIIYQNEFIKESKMKSLFEQCDIVLVPYKNVEASSGILGHSIAARKPVIGTKKGLLGEMIKKNKLGVLIDESTPECIACGIEEAMIKNYPKFENEYYLKEHSKEKFAEILLGSLSQIK